MTDNTHSNGTYSSLKLSENSCDELYAFCATLGTDNLVDPQEYHCTLVYSSTPCPDIEKEDYKLPFKAMMKGFKILGVDEKVLVIELFCPEAKDLHRLLKTKYNAHHDYDSYIPHITIAKNFEGEIPTEVFEGEIEFVGREIEGLDND